MLHSTNRRHQVQIMIGELDEKYDAIVARLGRAPILYAPQMHNPVFN